MVLRRLLERLVMYPAFKFFPAISLFFSCGTRLIASSSGCIPEDLDNRGQITMYTPRQKPDPLKLFCGLTIMGSAVLAMGVTIGLLEVYRGLLS